MSYGHENGGWMNEDQRSAAIHAAEKEFRCEGHIETLEPVGDPKDATIAALTEQRDALKAEVERLAGVLDVAKYFQTALQARALLRRLGLTLADATTSTVDVW